MIQILTSRSAILSGFLWVGMFTSSLSVAARNQYGWPTGIQIGADIMRPLQYKYNDRESRLFELNATMDFANWMLEGDFGWGSIHWNGKCKEKYFLSVYDSQGQYMRAGLNYNLLKDTPDKNSAFLGLRYAHSFFADYLKSRICYGCDSNGKAHVVDKGPTINSRQYGVRAGWFEVVAGGKVKLWKLLYIGGTIRYKFRLRIYNTNNHIPYDILGWGIGNKEEVIGFSCYLALRIPFVRNTSPKPETV